MSNTKFKVNPSKTSNSVGNLKESKQENFSESQQQKFDVLLKEMVLLKEKNKSMETELKEMQEGYWKISLKITEVEGEKQANQIKSVKIHDGPISPFFNNESFGTSKKLNSLGSQF